MRLLLALCTVSAVLFGLMIPGFSQQSKLEKRAHQALEKLGQTFDTEQEPNETSAKANSLAVPGGRTGGVAVGDATGIVINYADGAPDAIEDLFTVTLTQAARLDLQLTFANAAADLDLFLMSETNGQTTVLQLSNAPTTTERIITENPLAPGRYLVGVSAYSGGSSYTLTAANPDTGANLAPMLTSLNPNSAAPGAANLTLTINGANFVSGSTVHWNGEPRPTNYVSATRLTASINASDIGLAGVAFVNVLNPAPGGGASNALPFNITGLPDPDLEQEPNEISAQANSIAFPGRRVGVAAAGDAAAISIPYTDGTQDKLEDLFSILLGQSSRLDIALEFTNAGADLDLVLLRERNGQFSVLGLSNGDSTTERIVTTDPLAPGRYLIGVSSFSGGSSYEVTVAAPAGADNPSPTLSSLNPASAPAGGPGFQLALNGTNFIPYSQVLWNGVARLTNIASANQLTATINSSDLATAGTAFIAVLNPAPGGGLSNTIPFVITGAPAPDAEEEPNNASAQANALPVPGRHTGIVAVGDTSAINFNYADGSKDPIEDLFAITLNQSAQISLTLSFTNAAADLDLFLLTETSGQISALAFSNGDAMTERIITQGALAPGRYLVGVSAFTGASSYTLTAAITSTQVVTVTAASFAGPELARESIVAGFGIKMATEVEVATTIPLPTTLVGTGVKVRDSAGVERPAPLFFVSPGQVNYQIPPGTANGPANVIVTSGDDDISAGTAQIVSVAPALFSADSTGSGLAVGLALRVKADGSQTLEPIVRFDTAQNKFVAAPVDLGPVSDQVFLILFGVGVRFRSAPEAVTAKIGGVSAPVLYAGSQGGFVGLDQVNMGLPRSLAGSGEVDLELIADGKKANTVKVSFK